MLAAPRVKITWFDSRVLGDIVDDGLPDGDIIVDEGHALVHPRAAQHRDSGKATLVRPYHFL